jgi:hypothetical protein
VFKKKSKSFYFTNFQWFLHKITEEGFKRFSVLVFILAGLTAFILYHISIPLDWSKYLINASIGYVKFFGVDHVYDKTIKNALVTIISSLTIIISLLSAIYVFTHREQKSVSPSASTENKKNILVTGLLSVMIFNIVFGSLIIMEYNGLIGERNYTPSLEITKILYSRLTLLLISLIILIIFIDTFIKYLFRTMSVDKMLEDSVDYTSESIDKVINTNRDERFEDFLIERYRKFHLGIESVFQNLKYAAEHNMNKEFEENIDSFKDVISKLKIEDKRFDNKKISFYLLETDGVKFINAYNSALRSNLALISYLMKNQQYNKAKTAVSLYFNMFLDSDEKLRKIFKISLNDFLDFIDISSERQLLIFLDGLDLLDKEQSLITYNFLLMKLINKDQIKNLTNLVYASNKYSETFLLKKLTVRVLIQNLIKSIEISNYSITGFLVKFLITNFSGEDLNRGLVVTKINFNKGKLLYNSVLETEEKIEGINEDGTFAIKINDETFDYCFKKAYILLFAQHKFSLKKDLWYMKRRNETGNEIELANEFKECSYSEYIISKVKKAKDKYGLLLFEDEEVMRNVYSELNLNYPADTTQQKNFFATVAQILNKFL